MLILEGLVATRVAGDLLLKKIFAPSLREAEAALVWSLKVISMGFLCYRNLP